MPPLGRPSKKRIKRLPIPLEVRAELLKRGLTSEALARQYGVSRFVIANILAGFPFKKRGKWQRVKEQLLRDYPWLNQYLGDDF
jgi:predicted transcriptional regulator